MFFIAHIMLMNKYLLNEVMNDYENGPAFHSSQGTDQAPELSKQNVNYVTFLSVFMLCGLAFNI